MFAASGMQFRAPLREVQAQRRTPMKKFMMVVWTVLIAVLLSTPSWAQSSNASPRATQNPGHKETKAERKARKEQEKAKKKAEQDAKKQQKARPKK
jgi:hypothetical protein